MKPASVLHGIIVASHPSAPVFLFNKYKEHPGVLLTLCQLLLCLLVKNGQLIIVIIKLLCIVQVESIGNLPFNVIYVTEYFFLVRFLIIGIDKIIIKS